MNVGAPHHEVDDPPAQGVGVRVLEEWDEVGVADDDRFEAVRGGAGCECLTTGANGDRWGGLAVGQCVGAQLSGEEALDFGAELQDVHRTTAEALCLVFLCAEQEAGL